MFYPLIPNLYYIESIEASNESTKLPKTFEKNVMYHGTKSDTRIPGCTQTCTCGAITRI